MKEEGALQWETLVVVWLWSNRPEFVSDEDVYPSLLRLREFVERALTVLDEHITAIQAGE